MIFFLKKNYFFRFSRFNKKSNKTYNLKGGILCKNVFKEEEEKEGGVKLEKKARRGKFEYNCSTFSGRKMFLQG
jgi:hypothetical protein